jgi:hypothetical protein
MYGHDPRRLWGRPTRIKWLHDLPACSCADVGASGFRRAAAFWRDAGDDFVGWPRLPPAYMVLDAHDKADAAALDTRCAPAMLAGCAGSRTSSKAWGRRFE